MQLSRESFPKNTFLKTALEVVVMRAYFILVCLLTITQAQLTNIFFSTYLGFAKYQAEGSVYMHQEKFGQGTHL